MHLQDPSTKSKACDVEPSRSSENPPLDVSTKVARGKLPITVSSMIESQVGGSGSIEDDVSSDDELVPTLSPPQNPFTDAADIGVSSFKEACSTHHEDEGAKEDDNIVEKGKDEVMPGLPLLGKRERVVDVPATEAHKRARLETDSKSTDFPVESKLDDDPADALSPYGDEVDYEPTPSPPEALDMGVPLDEDVDIYVGSDTGGSQSEVPIGVRSFLIDRIKDIMKTVNR
ncbi:uncharacterized protein LOC109705045 [Ananas comosus]|uniref:Uncharacterized protein LOC109705045 n=1 Tax=Ananas comosus TaxID=4615 RepID=A0A6P5EJ00_ANACO|nr:uncharacterized protein LOC109705045 [Ananas comosus]